MFARKIQITDVESVLETGQVLKEYPDDKPYPSKLILGFVDDLPIHLVVAEDIENGTMIIVTAYRPDAELWCPDFTQRR